MLFLWTYSTVVQEGSHHVRCRIFKLLLSCSLNGLNCKIITQCCSSPEVYWAFKHIAAHCFGFPKPKLYTHTHTDLFWNSPKALKTKNRDPVMAAVTWWWITWRLTVTSFWIKYHRQHTHTKSIGSTEMSTRPVWCWYAAMTPRVQKESIAWSIVYRCEQWLLVTFEWLQWWKIPEEAQTFEKKHELTSGEDKVFHTYACTIITRKHLILLRKTNWTKNITPLVKKQ